MHLAAHPWLSSTRVELSRSCPILEFDGAVEVRPVMSPRAWRQMKPVAQLANVRSVQSATTKPTGIESKIWRLHPRRIIAQGKSESLPYLRWVGHTTRRLQKSRQFHRLAGESASVAIIRKHRPVGSRSGTGFRRSCPSVAPRLLWDCLNRQTMNHFQAPATSHPAWGFPHLAHLRVWRQANVPVGKFDCRRSPAHLFA